MKYVLLLTTIFMQFCKPKADTNIQPSFPKDTLLHLIQTGLPDLEISNQKNYIAKKYGIRYVSGGCITEKSALERIKKQNDSVIQIINLKYGKDWQTDVHSELVTSYDVGEIALTEMMSRQIKHNEAFYYLVTPGLQKNNFIVKVYSYSWDESCSYKIHYYICVDYRKRLVTEFLKTDELL